MGCVMLSSDEDVVRRLRADDPGTLEQLVAQYRQCLVRYADGILAGEGSGEDVVQETFLRLWTRRRRLRPGGSLRAFLYTLTKNAAIDERRRNARRVARAAVAPDPVVVPTPLEVLAASELARAAAAAVSRLPARRREIFTLVRIHGLSYREVADSMGVAPQTVANQMGTALASLRKALAHHGVNSSSRPRSSVAGWPGSESHPHRKDGRPHSLIRRCAHPGTQGPDQPVRPSQCWEPARLDCT